MTIEQSTKKTNTVALSGALTYDTVKLLGGEIKSTLLGLQSVTLDLSKVTFSNSAGLALLLDCYCFAKENQQTILFKNVPEQLRAIAKFTRLSPLLFAGSLDE